MKPSTSTTEDAGSLSLRAWPTKNTSTPPLATLIERIQTQKGSFRNVTEQSLEEEIAAQESGEGAEGESSESDEGEDEKSKKEQLFEAKGELLKFASQAFNESAHTLDFVSLLLSKYAPRQAEMTLSPYLKHHVPMGSLGSEVLETSGPDPAQERQENLVSTGWKLLSLSAGADRILQDASNLEKEMEKEAKYWEQVLAVKEKGWNVCRLPREKHTLAVRYGFLKAAPEFRDKGLAALRRDDDGSIDLDLGITSSAPRSVRIQILHGSEVVAASRHDDLLKEEQHSAEQAILQARNNLFDEELFHEIYREARMMTSRNVKCVRDGISLPMESDITMFIELRDVGNMEDPATKPSKQFEQLPQLALTAMRILLSASHRANYLRRTSLQPPLTERRPRRPIASILRPIISHFEHRSTRSELQTYMQDLSAVLEKAGIDFEYEQPETNLNLDQLLSEKRPAESRLVDALLKTLTAPPQCSIKARLGGEDGEDFTVQTRTQTMTDFRFVAKPSSPSSFLAQTLTEMTFTSIKEIKDHVSHMVILYLVDYIENQKEKWIASSPDEGELTTEETLDGDYEVLTVSVDTDRLELRWDATNRLDDEERVAVWSRGSIHGGMPAFFEKVEDFSNVPVAPSQYAH